MKIYPTYRFKTVDPVIKELRNMFEDRPHLSKQKISKKSGVAVGTMYNWLNEKTKRPQFCTANAVARALGMEFKLTPIAAPKYSTVRKVNSKEKEHYVEQRIG